MAALMSSATSTSRAGKVTQAVVGGGSGDVLGYTHVRARARAHTLIHTKIRISIKLGFA